MRFPLAAEPRILPAGLLRRNAAAVNCHGDEAPLEQGHGLYSVTSTPGASSHVLERIRQASLATQLAVIAAVGCLAVSLALAVMADLSSRHMQQTEQASFGNALAQQISRRISAALETGDLLSVAASLHRFQESASAEQVTLFDIEGRTLGQAGATSGGPLQHYRAPVLISGDIAGEIVIAINTEAAQTARLRFLLSLIGLMVLLSMLVYAATHHAAQRWLSSPLRRLADALALEDCPLSPLPVNEYAQLAGRIDLLPLGLLRARSSPPPGDENYRDTAVLYLHCISLPDYVDTLDERALHRYIRRLHQICYAAAGFYNGRLQVVRQFGIALYFSGANKGGSPAFRAAACAWLIREACHALEQDMSLSLNVALAVGLSELGRGDEGDIYPGLYLQPTLDELQNLCASKPPRVMLSPRASEDLDIGSRLELSPSELRDYAILESFAGPYQDMLDRQLQLILKKLRDL